MGIRYTTVWHQTKFLTYTNRPNAVSPIKNGITKPNQIYCEASCFQRNRPSTEVVLFESIVMGMGGLVYHVWYGKGKKN